VEETDSIKWNQTELRFVPSLKLQFTVSLLGVYAIAALARPCVSSSLLKGKKRTWKVVNVEVTVLPRYRLKSIRIASTHSTSPGSGRRSREPQVRNNNVSLSMKIHKGERALQ
jgi:hypothetical protein